MPIYDKSLKNLLQNLYTDDLEIWYVALCTRVLSRLFKLPPCADLDLFNVKVGYISFCMGKIENYVLLETIADIGLKVGLNIQVNEIS